MTSARRDQRGQSISVEFAVLVPALVVVIALVIGAGRLALAHITVQQWADSAARTATLARDAGSAHARARAVIASDAAGSDVRCAGGPQFALDSSAFSRPVGRPGSVAARVTCGVRLADLLLPGVPGTVIVERHASSTLDRYRGRG